MCKFTWVSLNDIIWLSQLYLLFLVYSPTFSQVLLQYLQRPFLGISHTFSWLIRLALTLQRLNTENSKQMFPVKKLRGPSPNFHIYVSVSDLYIPRIGPPILLQENMRTYPGNINRSQTHECGNWDWGRAIPRKEIHNWDFRCSVSNVLSLFASVVLGIFTNSPPVLFLSLFPFYKLFGRYFRLRTLLEPGKSWQPLLLSGQGWIDYQNIPWYAYRQHTCKKECSQNCKMCKILAKKIILHNGSG
jgi:hypothetical protein